jgi:hypothetical protein
MIIPFFLGESEYFRENHAFIKSILFNDKSEPNFKTATKVDYLLEQVKGRSYE